jgi:hypothetical protein
LIWDIFAPAQAPMAVPEFIRQSLTTTEIAERVQALAEQQDAQKRPVALGPKPNRD